MSTRSPRGDGGRAPYFQSSCSSAKASSSSSSSAPDLILALISFVIFLISFFVSLRESQSRRGPKGLKINKETTHDLV